MSAAIGAARRVQKRSGMSPSPSTAIEPDPSRRRERRLLRVGIVHGRRIVEERLLARPGDVTIGRSPRSTFIVPWDDVPDRWRLFEERGGRRFLHLAGDMTARIADGAAVTSIDAAPRRRAARRRSRCPIGRAARSPSATRRCCSSCCVRRRRSRARAPAVGPPPRDGRDRSLVRRRARVHGAAARRVRRLSAPGRLAAAAVAGRDPGSVHPPDRPRGAPDAAARGADHRRRTHAETRRIRTPPRRRHRGPGRRRESPASPWRIRSGTSASSRCSRRADRTASSAITDVLSSGARRSIAG